MLKNPETRICVFCETPYQTRATTQRFCSYDCRFRQRSQDARLAREAEKAAAEAALTTQ